MEADVPKVRVQIKNSLWSVTGSPSIEVNYVSKNKKVKHTVASGQNLDIGRLIDLSPDQPISIMGYGEVKAQTVGGTQILRDTLIAEAHNLDAEKKKKQLKVEVRWKDWTGKEITLHFGFPETEIVPAKGSEEAVPTHPWDAFPRIKSSTYLYYGVTPIAVLGAASWKVNVLPGLRVMRSTTAEDMYRYILNLTKADYTKDDVIDSHRILSLKWHPDKFSDETKYSDKDREVVKTIQQLLNASRDGLLQALEEK
jgi:hypothetical protein